MLNHGVVIGIIAKMFLCYQDTTANMPTSTVTSSLICSIQINDDIEPRGRPKVQITMFYNVWVQPRT